MDLHILDHRLRVTSISKTGLEQYTHPLIKLIFLRNRTRCKFFSLTETPENYTVVLDEEGFKVITSCWLSLFILFIFNAFFSCSPKEGASVDQDMECIKFFSFSLIDGYVSLVMDTEAQRQFPTDLLFTSSSGELWRMVRIGGQPLGFDECGIVAQISQPLADSDISAYYISTFSFDHALVPEEDMVSVTEMLQAQRMSS
ncbi:GATS-like protein 2 [Sinocyclocheilus anshuiensis]|uniref:GATS-like protein 2 n=1 Tax=Sinocyclocheilus anshuiensis TaxID=1608454 RepID=UPI0007B9EE4F|nr:PREDICTED: GATS-like protein 2 [Sinocyclocheilus anshuiensis]